MDGARDGALGGEGEGGGRLFGALGVVFSTTGIGGGAGTEIWNGTGTYTGWGGGGVTCLGGLGARLVVVVVVTTLVSTTSPSSSSS